MCVRVLSLNFVLLDTHKELCHPRLSGPLQTVTLSCQI